MPRSGIRRKTIGVRREILADAIHTEKVVLGLTLDKDMFGFEDAEKQCHVPYGAVLGKVEDSGLFRLCTRGKLEEEASSGVDVIVLSDRRNFGDDIQPVPFVVGDEIIIGSGGTAETKTITAIDYETLEVTLNSVLSNTQAADTVVKGTDGSQDAVTILDEEADVTHNNFVAGGFRKAYVIKTKLPYVLDIDEETKLLGNSNITFMA